MTSSSPQPTPLNRDNRDNRDRDQFWVAGVFYVNPNDSRLLVEKRFAMGWTFNFAHPIAWWLLGGPFIFLALVQLVFFLIFHYLLNLFLLGLFVALSLLVLVGYLRIGASRQR